MKRNLKKKTLIIGIPAIIIILLVINPDLSLGINDPFGDIADIDLIQQGELFQLEFINTHIDCRSVSQLQIKQNGVYSNTVASGDDFNPITQEIVHRLSNETIESFRVLILLKCDYPSYVEDITVSGSYFAQIATGALSNDIPIVSKSGTIGLIHLNSGEYKILKAYEISSASIEPKLVQHDPPNAYFKAFTQPSYDFTIFTTGGGQQPAESGRLLQTVKVTYRVIIQDDIQPTSGGDAIARTSPMFIDSITRVIDGIQLLNGANTLDTAGSGGRQIFIEATLRNYATSEGSPYLIIGGKTIVMFFQKFQEDDAEFGAYYFMPRDSTERNHQITLKAVNRPDVKATAIITVENNPITTSFTCPDGTVVSDDSKCPAIIDTNLKLCSDGTKVSIEKQCPVGTTTIGEVAKIKINYKIFFNDNTNTLGNIQTLPTFESTLTALGLVSNVEGSDKGKKILSIHLEPFVSIKDKTLQGWQITLTDIKYDVGIVVENKRTSMVILNTQNFATITGTATTNELSLGSIIINNIDQLISNTDFAKSLASDEQQPAIIDVKINGKFKMVRNNIDKFEGFTDGAVFNYDVIYSSGGNTGGKLINSTIKCNPDTQYVDQITNADSNQELICKNKESNEIEKPVFCSKGSKAVTIEGFSICQDIETGETTEPKIEEEPKCDGLPTFEYLICIGEEVISGDKDKEEKDETLDNGATSNDDSASGDPGKTIICEPFLCASAISEILDILNDIPDPNTEEFNDMLYIIAGGLIIVIIIILALKRRNPIQFYRRY